MGQIECFVDGASRGQGQDTTNIAACAAVIYKDRKMVASYARALGPRSNNEAEYEAVLLGLLMCAMADWHNPIIYTDSAVVANQVKGKWKCTSRQLLPLLISIQSIKESFYFQLQQVPRSEVHPADTEANKFLDHLGDQLTDPKLRKKKKKGRSKNG